MDYKLYLVLSILNTDLEHYAEDEDILNYAIEFAKSKIAERLNVATNAIPPKYDVAIVEGSKWYLARIGTEGEVSNTEGTITRQFETIPSWLKSIAPYVGVVKVAPTK